MGEPSCDDYDKGSVANKSRPDLLSVLTEHDSTTISGYFTRVVSSSLSSALSSKEANRSAMCLSASVNLGYLDLNFSSANILEYAVLITSISLSVTKVVSEF